MLGDDIAQALVDLRAEAESRMRDSFTIRREGDPVWNPETMQNEPAITTVYSGRGRLRPTTLLDQGDTVADQVYTKSEYVLSLPVVASAGIRKGDVATCDRSATDPGMVGRSYTIVVAASHSDATARRFPVRETQ